MGDLRQHKRFPFAFLVAWPEGPGATLRDGTGLDISVRGCKIQTFSPPTPGARLQLQLEVPLFLDAVVIDEAVVRWTIGWDFGVEFVSLQADQQDRLQALIRTLELRDRRARRHVPDPTMPSRMFPPT